MISKEDGIFMFNLLLWQDSQRNKQNALPVSLVTSKQSNLMNQPIEEKTDKIVTEGYRLGHLAIPSTEYMVQVQVEKQLEERFGPKPPQILTKKDL